LPLVVKEVAILFESGSNSFCDIIITVVAPLETRIQRVLERDNTNRENILARINNQWTDEQRISKSDFIIHNISVDEAKKEVDEILKLLKNQ
jgi:dephospho-CoA kinase